MKSVSGAGYGFLLAAAALAATGMCIYSLYGISVVGFDVFQGRFAQGVVGLVGAGVIAGPITSYYAARDGLSGSP